jgi:hypothetical protein
MRAGSCEQPSATCTHRTAAENDGHSEPGPHARVLPAGKQPRKLLTAVCSTYEQAIDSADNIRACSIGLGMLVALENDNGGWIVRAQRAISVVHDLE